MRQLHDEAMVLAQRAMVARETGEAVVARELARQAMTLEAEAAGRITKEVASEPTRSILHRSAASLAFHAGETATAQRLVFEGLAGYPPPSVEQELKDLYDQLNFAAHLQPRGVVLGDSKIRLSLVGDQAGAGQVVYSAFRTRVDTLINMLDRTMRRLLDMEYSPDRRGKGTGIPFVPLISSPQAGSFAVIVELAQRGDVPISFFLPSSKAVVDEVIAGTRLVQEDRMDELRSRIGDDAYLVNFVSDAKQLAPDGKNVKMVGLSAGSAEVAFTMERGDVRVPTAVSPEALAPPNRETLRGVLDLADAPGERLRLTTPAGKKELLRVREGLDDLVRANFNTEVEVEVERWAGAKLPQLVSLQQIED